MKKCMMVAALCVFAGAATAMAEGVPSSAKLNKLGLSSMNVAPDADGYQVRGKGFGGGYYTFAVSVADPAAPGNGVAVGFAGAFTFGQDPRAAAGDVVFGSGGVDPIAPGSPITANLATPNWIATASAFGIMFGQGN